MEGEKNGTTAIVVACVFSSKLRPGVGRSGCVFHFRSCRMNFHKIPVLVSGQGSSVGIATDYGLDGPGSNPGGDEIFHPSIPALGPTQPPVKWVPGLSRG
jgi:hypothetical protein